MCVIKVQHTLSAPAEAEVERNGRGMEAYRSKSFAHIHLASNVEKRIKKLNAAQLFDLHKQRRKRTKKREDKKLQL